MSLLKSRALWIGLVIVALTYGASYGLRQSLVEPSAAAMACAAHPYPSWCLIRFAMLIGQKNELFGAAALVAGVLALFRGGRGVATAAAALSMLAITNFNVEMGVLALVFGLIASVRERPLRRLRDDAPRA